MEIEIIFKNKYKSIYIKNKKTKYLISKTGKVLNSKTGRILKPIKTQDGYLKVNLSHNNKTYNKKIHILVAKAFITNSIVTYNMINHIDGDKCNNNYKNLEWCDNSYNQLHAHRMKLYRKPPFKNPEKMVHLVCECLQNNMTTSEIKKYLADFISINNIQSDIKTLILHVRRRKIYKHISENYKW